MDREMKILELSPELKKMSLRFYELFEISSEQKRKDEYEKIYSDFNIELLIELIHRIIPKFFRIEKLIFQDMNIKDLKQDLFLETWNDLKSEKPISKDYLIYKIYDNLIFLIKENLHQLTPNLNVILDIEANLTIENLKRNSQSIPIYLIIKKEYFKQLIYIIDENLDFTEKTVFILHFFLEVEMDLISEIMNINIANLDRIYRISRSKLIRIIAGEELGRYGELVSEFREINRFSDAEELKTLVDYNIFDLRCIKNWSTEQICNELNMNPPEFKMRLLDFFENLIKPLEPVPDSGHRPDLDIDLENIMDIIEATGEHDLDPDKIGTGEKNIVQNFLVLVKMTRISKEFKQLSNFLRYRLSIGTKEIPRKFFEETGISEIDLENMIKNRTLPTMVQLHKIEKYFFLPKNYLIDFLK